jgi:dihydrofolate reductase
MERPLTLILAALVPSLAIGRSGTLPWKLAREMKYFRQVTTGGIVIMGRSTWESIPPKFRPLKGRVNVVLTRSGSSYGEEVIVASSLEDAQTKLANVPGRIFVIGGAEVYKAALMLPQTKNVLLTEVCGEIPACDAFFDFPWSETGSDGEWTRASFDELKSFIGEAADGLEDGHINENGLSYRFTLWKRQHDNH